MPKRQMHLTAFCNPPGRAWQWREANEDFDMSLAENIRWAQAAERGKLDMIFYQDTAAVSGANAIAAGSRSGDYRACVRPEPMSLIAALATVTSRIGLSCGTVPVFLSSRSCAGRRRRR